MKIHLKTAVFLLLAIIAFNTTGFAKEWLTGPALQQHLSDPIDLMWSDNPLRDAIGSFARSQRIAVLLDRRIDPSRRITLSLKETSLAETLFAVAMTGELGATVTDSVAYFGPAETASKLRTLLYLRQEEAKKLPPAAGKILLQVKPLSWDDFSQPREILERLGRDSHITIDGSEKIPYDRWAAADLPPMSLIERISLVAVQYDLTFAIVAGGKRLELTPLPAEIRLSRSYPGGKQPDDTAKRFAEHAPRAEIEVVGDKVAVKGSLEDHERIDASRKPPAIRTAKNAASKLDDKRFTLKYVEKPIGPFLKQLAKQLDLQLQMDEQAIAQAGVSLDQNVSFKVEDATIDQLLQAAIKTTPLQYRRQGNVLKVEAMKQ